MANICAAVLSFLNKPAKAQEITACQLRPAVGIDVRWDAAGRLVDGHRFLLLTCPPEDTGATDCASFSDRAAVGLASPS